MPVEVLCGPVLRRVTAESVTVFLALRSAQRVTLRVYAGETEDGAGAEVRQVGSRDTVRLGVGLHVVSVTTGTAGGVALTAGDTYRYQVFFGAHGGDGHVPESAPSLFTPGWVAGTAAEARTALGYDRPGQRLPGFQLAPDDPGLLRVLHGVDRLPHAAGPDGLAAADELIGAAIRNGGRRPHLLVLSGNQIHADEVSATMLAVVRRAVAELGLRDDVLPDATAAEQPATLGPGRRAGLTARARFVTPAASHLLSFAEYAAMYLLAWSDVLWPAQLPALEEVHPGSGWSALPPETRNLVELGAPYDLGAGQAEGIAQFVAWSMDAENLRAFRAGLPAVRRAMANVPVLTSPGEHEVSGGWNAVRGRAAPMLGNATARRVIANGLAAHAVFQAWGNTPERFEGNTAGGVLLQRLTDWLAQPAPGADPHADTIATLAGLPSAALVRPPAALSYHYLLARPRWQLLVLDTQTQRGYPASAGDPPAPLADAALDAALATLPAATPDAVTIVVSQTPVLRTPPQDEADFVVETTSWASAPVALHRMLGRLVTQGVAAGAGGVRRRRLVLLSGGAGAGYAVRLRYSADTPYAAGAAPVEAVVAHLVAGPARHPNPLGEQLHRDGYLPGTPALPSREFVGWDVDLSTMNPRPSALTIGVQYFGPDARTLSWQVRERPQLSEVTGDRRLDRRPQWRCRAEFVASDLGQLGPVRPGERLPVTPPEPPNPAEVDPVSQGPVPAAPEPWPVATFVAAAANQRQGREAWSAGTQIVGEASLTDLAFAIGTDGDLTQTQATVWWRLPGKEPQPLTRFSVSTEPGESCYDQDRYLGRALRREDRDAAAGVDARYEGITHASGRLVRDLQRDLVALGFLVAGTDPEGQFGPRTEWAVREFQNYARCSTVAREREYADGAPVPVRYVDKLEAVAVPPEDRYRTEEGLSGVVNRRTRRLISVWLERRWRCPVVIEALRTGAGNVPVSPADGNHNNIWLHTEPGNGVRRVFATDFTGRYPDLPAARLYGQPAPTVPPPDGAPALPPLVQLGKWTKWDVPNGPPDGLELRFEGQTTDPELDQVWRPDMEMLPEHTIDGSPTLATLVADAAAGTPAALTRLSTYKVYRAVSEVEAIGYFDSFNAYDNSFISVGPCHWTAGRMSTQTGFAGPQPNWSVGSGELWGFLALVRHRHPAEFERCFRSYGLDVTGRWESRAIWDSDAHKYISTPQLDTELHPETLTPRARDYDYLRTWHWYYRFIMAVRTSEAIRREMWHAARQRMVDALETRWTVAAGNEGVPDVSVERPNRRPAIREVFTSERAVGFIYRWHILSPGGVVNDGAPGDNVRAALAYARVGQCTPCATHADAAVRAHRADPAPWAAAPGPAFNTPPDTWTDAHESALIAGLMHRSRYHSNAFMRQTIAQVDGWPGWRNSPGNAITAANPRGFALPLGDLPDGTAPPGVNERQLKTGRNTFHLDAAGVPWPGGRQNQEDD